MVSIKALSKKSVDPRALIAVCTDNLATMQASHWQWCEKFPWILVSIGCMLWNKKNKEFSCCFVQPLACLMHGINNIVGKVVAYPKAKAVIIKNSRIVSFFNLSHYWGGQLDIIARGKGITRKLKTNTESQFYSLVLQAMSVWEHKPALSKLCNMDTAQRAIGGLMPVAKDMYETVFNLDCWAMTDQLIRICKPLVDIIGDTESCDATLADCMLQLI